MREPAGVVVYANDSDMIENVNLGAFYMDDRPSQCCPNLSYDDLHDLFSVLGLK